MMVFLFKICMFYALKEVLLMEYLKNVYVYHEKVIDVPMYIIEITHKM